MRVFRVFRVLRVCGVFRVVMALEDEAMLRDQGFRD